MQDVILDEFEAEGNLRGYQLPIMPDKRKKPDKLQRIEAVSPLWERGFVFYNEKLKESADMQTGIEQTLALERGSRIHDDAPDADEGAICILQRNSRQESFQPVFRQCLENRCAVVFRAQVSRYFLLSFHFGVCPVLLADL